MLGGFLKFTLFLNVLFLFVTLLWQVATADATSALTTNNNLAKSNDDIIHLLAQNNNDKSASVVKRSSHPIIDPESLMDTSSLIRSRPRHRRLRKKLHLTKLDPSLNTVQSTGIHKKNHRSSKRIQAIIDDRLKRFRMLDPEEFQEMLSSMSEQQQQDEQPTGLNNMDAADGIQLQSYWSRK